MLHHVQIAAPEGSEDRLRAFYTGVLGWSELPKPDSTLPTGTDKNGRPETLGPPVLAG